MIQLVFKLLLLQWKNCSPIVNLIVHIKKNYTQTDVEISYAHLVERKIGKLAGGGVCVVLKSFKINVISFHHFISPF